MKEVSFECSQHGTSFQHSTVLGSVMETYDPSSLVLGLLGSVNPGSTASSTVSCTARSSPDLKRTKDQERTHRD